MKTVRIRYLPVVLCFVGMMLIAVSPGYPQENPRVLVVYYSRDGHTKSVADALAKKFNADIEGLIDTKKRTGPVGTPAAGKDAITGKMTRIKKVKTDPQKYDIILLGTPSWFSNPAPAIRTYVVQHDLTGRKVGVFGTTHLTGVENCLEKLAELAAPGNAQAVPRLPLRHKDLGKDDLPKKIDEFYRQVLP